MMRSAANVNIDVAIFFDVPENRIHGRLQVTYNARVPADQQYQLIMECRSLKVLTGGSKSLGIINCIKAKGDFNEKKDKSV